MVGRLDGRTPHGLLTGLQGLPRAPTFNLSMWSWLRILVRINIMRPGRIISISIDLRIDLPGWRGSTGDIPPMAGLYWRIYYQIENPRIGELQWRTSTGGPLMAGNRICEGWNGDGVEILIKCDTWECGPLDGKMTRFVFIHTWYLRMWTFRIVYFIIQNLQHPHRSGMHALRVFRHYTLYSRCVITF